jgi:hypothetical protein
VRFITQYSQAALPVSNDSAFYAFIGITDDGAYLVSATLPVTHPLFVADGMTEPAEGWAAFVENYEAYIDAIWKRTLRCTCQTRSSPNWPLWMR